MVIRVSAERFDELVEEALLDLPEDLARSLENVAIIVEDRSEDLPLLGLYEGVPLTRRGPLSYRGVLPDRITIYQETICAHCDTEVQLASAVRKTVIHEVAHHFGISDAKLKDLGWA